ncbi:MAG: biotin/lipoyl-binding protein, partial [Kiritimatiellota bacterium]|nr:biotin/lipoyl-binding protein [Kiritimatiellota bacterium]
MPAPKPSPVAVPKAPTVNTVIAAGRLAFATDMKLTFGTSGKVSKVNVTELDKVTKGQILAQLDTTDLNQAVKTAEFAVKTAEFALTSAQLDRQTAEAAIKSADTDVSTAQEAVKSAGVDLDKYADALRKISYPYTYTTLFVDVPQALLLINDASRQISDAAAGMRAGLSPEKTTEISSKLQQALDNLNLTRDKLAVGQGYSELFATSTDAKGITTQNINLYWSLRAAQL